jgi:acyl-CoA thioesterase FadM
VRNVELDELAATCDLTAVYLGQKSRKSCAFPEAVRATAELLLVEHREPVGEN